MAGFEAISGLAGEIRSSLTSEQFDLGGYTEQRARDLVIGAFSTPLDAPTEMVRFTFVVGGGKLVRARYSDDLPKWMTTALRDVGFTEDRSAACTFDCQGTYKQQHDTGQNLKTLSVFPRVACANVVSKSASGATADAPPDTNSPEYLVTACELSTFKEIFASKTSTWRQRKNLLKILQDASDKFQSLEAKLVHGELLSPAEQIIYDSNNGQDTEKITWLQNEIKAMVDAGQLSASEKDELSKSLATNITSLIEEIEKATQENKPKRVEKLNEKKQSILLRKDAVDKITPIIPKLKLAEEIVKLRIKLLSLLALEDKGRSMSLTLADLKEIESKSEIEDQIKQYENASRGWFEEQEDFDIKCKAEEKEANAKYIARVKAAAEKKKTSSTSKGGTQGKMAGGLPSSSGGGGGGSWSSVAPKKKIATATAKKLTTTSGFAAAFGGDSDDD
eukprot:gene3179-6274_t